jgi:hypothetical protein
LFVNYLLLSVLANGDIEDIEDIEEADRTGFVETAGLESP